MNMFESIFARKSIRHFLPEKIEWDVLADFLKFADNLPMLIEGIAVEFKLINNVQNDQKYTGMFSIKAPYYLSISSEPNEDYLINAGYLMQQLNLYLTSKGLGSCFMGSAKPKKSMMATMKYEYIITLGFGKTMEPPYRDSADVKRLPEEDVVVYKEEVRPEIKQMITAARLAPSSMNSQPWRFVVYQNRIHIFCKKNVFLSSILSKTKMIDIGISLANLLLAAEELWVDTSLTKSDIIKSKQFHNNDYILSVVIG